MDKATIIDLAENEVFASDHFDLNPEVRNFKSLFSNEICPRKNDLQTALSFYETLSDEEIERRYCIHYWEDCTLDAFDTLHYEVMENVHRSIDERELARREIKNVELLLNEGKFQIMANKEHILIEEIPAMYEKLITGTWSNFFIAEELEAYEIAREEDSQKAIRALVEMDGKRKEMTDIEFVAWSKSITHNGPKYVDYFNSDWVVAMQIQALIWYKSVFEKIMMTGTNYLAGLAQERKETVNKGKGKGKGKGISMNVLRRSNDGYEAITSSYEHFTLTLKRNPQWGELMFFMLKNPPEGINITGKQKGQKVEEISIEGIEKPIDRDAFRKRFERYFIKTDNKQDNR